MPCDQPIKIAARYNRLTSDQLYQYARYVCNLDKGEKRINKKTYSLVVKLFNEEILELIYKDHYVFKLPFNMGILYMGEEINKRKRIKKLVTDEDGNTSYKLVQNNNGVASIFRLRWEKEGIKHFNAGLYYFYSERPARSKIGRYIEEQNSSSDKKNYRAYPIIRN